MKLFIILLAAAVTVAGVAQAARNHGRIDEPAAGDPLLVRARAGDLVLSSFLNPQILRKLHY